MIAIAVLPNRIREQQAEEFEISGPVSDTGPETVSSPGFGAAAQAAAPVTAD